MQYKTLDMHIFSSTKNFSDKLGAYQAVGGRLGVDNRRYNH